MEYVPHSAVERHASLPSIDFEFNSGNLKPVSGLLTKQAEVIHYGSEPVLSPIGECQHELPSSIQSIPTGSENDLTRPPPPKPSRIPSIKYQAKPTIKIRNIDLYKDDDRDYSDYSQVKSDPSFISKPQGVVKYSFETSCKKKHSLVGQHSRSKMVRKVSSKKQTLEATESLNNAILTLASITQDEVGDTIRNIIVQEEGVHMRQGKRIYDQENNNSYKYSPNSSDDYDNNFRKATVISDEKIVQEQDYDVPTSGNKEVQSPDHTKDVKPPYLHLKTKKRLGSDTRFSILDTKDYGFINEIPTRDTEEVTKVQEPTITLPDAELKTRYDLNTYVPKLLSAENKPLDSSAVVAVKTLLTETKSRTLAQILTKIDMELFTITETDVLGLGLTSGLELLTLPHGQHLRDDILERYNCLTDVIALTILTGVKVQDRARMLSCWLELALELKVTMGNIFSFSTIMNAINLPQIYRLDKTWATLRMNHTKSAFQYDSKLKPFMKSLDDGTANLPLENISIPHITPLVQLFQRSADTMMDMTPWEVTDVDSGLDIILVHLDTARLITAHTELYRLKGQSILKTTESDEKLQEIFETPFQMRLLWGWRGASVNRSERYNKFIQILSALSQRAEQNTEIAATL